MMTFLTTFTSRNNLWLLLLVCLIPLGTACKQAGSAEDRGKAVVRFENEYLYAEDLEPFIPDSLSSDDSARFAQRYIDLWVRREAISAQARAEIPQVLKEIGPKVVAYRQSLLEHEYARFLVENNAEKFEVSESDIQNYYNKYPEKFISRANFYQYFYVKTDKPNQYKVVTLMRSKEAEKLEELIEWSEENATEYKLDSTYQSDAELDRISDGFESYGNIRRASKTTPYPYYHREGEVTYYDFFRLLNSINPGDQLPLSLCRDNIITIIRNQRKQALIDQTTANLVQQAKIAKKVTLY